MVSKEEMRRLAGFPSDPAIRELERKLGNLAAKWRRTTDKAVVDQYHKTYRELQRLGWEGSLDLESCLPDHLMPPAQKNSA